MWIPLLSNSTSGGGGVPVSSVREIVSAVSSMVKGKLEKVCLVFGARVASAPKVSVPGPPPLAVMS